MKLNFEPLVACPSIMADTIRVSQHFYVHIFHDRATPNNPPTSPPIYSAYTRVAGKGLSDVVWAKESPDGVFRGIDLARVEDILKDSARMVYAGDFQVRWRVKAKWGMSPWTERFACAEGYDLITKRGYCRTYYGPGNWKFIK